jgi:hypothetical protein
MKTCPSCAFLNEERFPTCVLCNAILVDVISTPALDPNSREHENEQIGEQRREIIRGQLRFLAIVYVVSITFTAIIPGMVFHPIALLGYLLSSGVVINAMQRDFVGQFTSGIAQGIFSLILLVYFGPLQPFIFFMFVGHITLPAIFWHWMELIRTNSR